MFIVEDSDPVRRRLIASLSALEDVQVVGSAGSESEALAAIRDDPPDAAIVDIQLRSGNGMNVLKEAKRLKADLRVMMLTNFGYPQYRRRCLEDGADCFLDKSTEFMAVEAIILEWARQAARRKPVAEKETGNGG